MNSQPSTEVLIATGAEPEVTLGERFKKMTTRFRLGPVLAVLVLTWAFFSILNPLFLSPVNLSNLVMQTAATATIAIGLVFILLLGEIDLSVAALSAVCAAIAASLAVGQSWPVVIAILVSLLAGIGWALLQGLLVLFGAPSFIVTLAGSLALGGVLLLVLPESGQIGLGNSDLKYLSGSYVPAAGGWILGVVAIAITTWFLWSKYRGRLKFGLRASMQRDFLIPAALTAVGILAVIMIMNNHRGVPVVFASVVGIIAILSYVLTQTKFGVNIYAVGGNREAARRAGIAVGPTILSCFVIAGLFAALGGNFAASRLLGVSNQSGGGTLLLEAIAAVIIGGTSLFGGRGTVWSALLGALLIGSINNGMDLLGLPTSIKLVVTGTVLTIATLSDVVLSRGTLSWRKR